MHHIWHSVLKRVKWIDFRILEILKNKHSLEIFYYKYLHGEIFNEIKLFLHSKNLISDSILFYRIFLANWSISYPLNSKLLRQDYILTKISLSGFRKFGEWSWDGDRKTQQLSILFWRSYVTVSVSRAAKFWTSRQRSKYTTRRNFQDELRFCSAFFFYIPEPKYISRIHK